MIIKVNDLKKFIREDINFYLFYGPNTGLIEEIINKHFKPIFSKNIMLTISYICLFLLCYVL